MRSSGDTLRAFNNDLTVLCHIQIHCVGKGNMETILIQSHKQNIDQILNDLAKCQRYDGKIVTLQTKYGNTDQQTKNTCKCGADQQRTEKAKPGRHCGIFHDFGEKGTGKGTDTHKSGMTEAQLSQDAYRKVQRYRQNRISTQRNQ